MNGKYKCIKSDAFKILKVGEIYTLREKEDILYIEGQGIAIEKEDLYEWFEPVEISKSD